MTFLIAKTVIRVAIALVISIVWINSIPAYGMPFGGCDVYGLTTFELGCSTWPEFIRGFGFVMIWLLIAPAHTWLHLFVFLLLAIFSVSYEVMINGLEQLQDADGWRLVIAQIFPIMLGGLVAFGIFSGVLRFAQK